MVKISCLVAQKRRKKSPVFLIITRKKNINSAQSSIIPGIFSKSLKKKKRKKKHKLFDVVNTEINTYIVKWCKYVYLLSKVVMNHLNAMSLIGYKFIKAHFRAKIKSLRLRGRAAGLYHSQNRGGVQFIQNSRQTAAVIVRLA